MASSINLPNLQGALLKSNFLGQNHLSNRLHKPYFPNTKRSPTFHQKPYAKFNLYEIMGGRGLCNGEKGIEQELKRTIPDEESKLSASEQENSTSTAISTTTNVLENAFEKELMGLTGGFPGGEKGLQLFVEKNPPPKKLQVADSGNIVEITTSKKPKAPVLPILLPGMFAIVKNPNNPFYMYCGIVQRITDGKVGVLFEGGNWDRLITFRLDELERRDKGPPGKNPKSVILEPMLQKRSK